MILVNWWQNRNGSASAPEAPKMERSAKVEKTPPSAAMASARPKLALNKTPVEPTKPLTRVKVRHVHFQIEDGFGVAFGDTLLGEPKQGVDGEGLTEVPKTTRWPTSRIPYFIKPDVSDPARIARAVDYFNQSTPVQLVPFEGQDDALVFENGKGCKSYVGRIGGHQPILLEAGCQTQEIIHEIMHALGFVHEQSRTDRDRYVKVDWDNVDEKYKYNFEIVPDVYMGLVPYNAFDFESIMLYPTSMFAKVPGATTLEPVGPSDHIQPVSVGISRSDLARLIKLFQP